MCISGSFPHKSTIQAYYVLLVAYLECAHKEPQWLCYGTSSAWFLARESPYPSVYTKIWSRSPLQVPLTRPQPETDQPTSNNNNVYLSISLPVAPTWSKGHSWNASFHFSFLILRQSVGLLGRGISPTQGRYLQGHHKRRINADRHPYLE
jgi:hypothetical protein